MVQYAWLIWSSLLLIVWAIIYFSLNTQDKKREMLIVSLWTSLLGLSEPFFVPEYWSPPSLFDLALRTGFDIESLIFSFGVGGIAVVIYERIFPVIHQQMTLNQRHLPRHRYHLFALMSAPLLFLLLIIATKLNPIYSSIIAMAMGGLFTWYCRPDLKRKMFVSAGLFTILYFVYFLTLIAMFPGYVEKVWNLKAISGILIVGIPLEELFFAASLGFLWSSIYEHLKWRKLKSGT